MVIRSKRAGRSKKQGLDDARALFAAVRGLEKQLDGQTVADPERAAIERFIRQHEVIFNLVGKVRYRWDIVFDPVTFDQLYSFQIAVAYFTDSHGEKLTFERFKFLKPSRP